MISAQGEKGKTMPRLIDADALLQRAIPHGWSTPKWVSDIAIEDAPTIEAIQVVRCKDCKYMEYMSTCTKNGIRISRVPNDYCSRGVRKDE